MIKNHKKYFITTLSDEHASIVRQTLVSNRFSCPYWSILQHYETGFEEYENVVTGKAINFLLSKGLGYMFTICEHSCAEIWLPNYNTTVVYEQGELPF